MTTMDEIAVRQTIEETGRKFGKLLSGKDFRSLAALYSEDAQVLAPDAPPITGRKDIEQFWMNASAALGLRSATLTTTAVEVSGDMACELGEADLELSDSRAGLKYLVVWRKGGDDVWRLHRDIWNNAPAST